jgi:SOS-response transcriptional repressor LexA
MIGERIKDLRHALGLSQTALAAKIDIKPSAVSQMESNKILPSLQTLSQLAAVCEVNLHWLITGRGQMLLSGKAAEESTERKLEKVRNFIQGELAALVRNKEEDRDLETVDIPVSGEIAAGQPAESVEPGLEFLTVRRSMINGVEDNYVCLRVNGHSMEPMVCNNDLVLIRQNRDWNSLAGQICALRIDGGITLKRLTLDERNKLIVLLSLNEEYQPILVNPEEHQDITLIGSLYYLMRKV